MLKKVCYSTKLFSTIGKNKFNLKYGAFIDGKEVFFDHNNYFDVKAPATGYYEILN
jgi:hypothetical protein